MDLSNVRPLRPSKRWSSAIIKTINKATGKELTKMTDFNQVNWASVTNGYLLSMKKALSSTSKFDLIISAAKTFMKATFRTGDTTASTSDATAQPGPLTAPPRSLGSFFGNGPWAELIAYG